MPSSFQDWATITTKQIFATEKLIHLVIKEKHEQIRYLCPRDGIVSFYDYDSCYDFDDISRITSILSEVIN